MVYSFGDRIVLSDFPYPAVASAVTVNTCFREVNRVSKLGFVADNYEIPHGFLHSLLVNAGNSSNFPSLPPPRSIPVRLTRSYTRYHSTLCNCSNWYSVFKYITMKQATITWFKTFVYAKFITYNLCSWNNAVNHSGTPISRITDACATETSIWTIYSPVL